VAGAQSALLHTYDQDGNVNRANYAHEELEDGPTFFGPLVMDNMVDYIWFHRCDGGPV